MKKYLIITLSLLIVFGLVLTTIAQDIIYLPIITKGGDDCMGTPILEITDGTNTINLLDAGISIGIVDWTPQAPPVITTAQSSPLTSGSDVSHYKFSNANETFDFNATGEDQDSVIETVQDFRRLLIQGLNYQVVDWHNSIVYIKAKAKCETNIRYAVVKSFSLPEDDFPFGQPFTATPPVMNNMSVIIERGDWLGAVPGVGECQEISAQQVWQYDDGWEVIVPVADTAFALLEADNNYVYAGYSSDIYRSTDLGNTWALNTALPTSLVLSMVQAANGDILAGQANGTLMRTQDNGASWANIAGSPTRVSSIIRLKNGNLLLSDLAIANGIYISTDNGSTWTLIHTFNAYKVSFVVGTLFQADNGDIYYSSGIWIYRSVDNGYTWSFIQNIFSFPDAMTDLQYIFQGNDGTLYAVSRGDEEAWSSVDNGSTWKFLVNVGSMIELSNGIFFGGVYTVAPAGDIYKSEDNATSFTLQSTISASVPWIWLELSNGSLIASDSQQLLKNDFSVLDLGGENSCNNIAYLINKTTPGQLTHIKIDDGGAYTDIFPMTTFSTAIYPAVPVANDAVYFGSDTSIDNTGPFSGLVFDIDDNMIAGLSYFIVWEYYDGAAWVLLPVTDYTKFNNASFEKNGIGSVTWEQPNDWATVAVDGVTAWWVRARVLVVTGGINQTPTQQNRQIYAINRDFFEVDADNIGGDIPAIAEHKLFNRSDSGGLPASKVTGTHTGANNAAILTDAAAAFDDDGVLVGWYVYNTTDGSVGIIQDFDATTITATLTGGTDNDWDTNDAYIVSSGPDLYSQRVTIGLRSQSRGDLFDAFINLSDEQEPFGITITAGTNATFGADSTTPTGRRLTYGALAGDTTFVDRATITMSSGVVRDYYGKFHIFLRARQATGAAGDITVRAQIKTGSGGITYTTPEKTFAGTNDWELIDLDAVTIPAGGRTIIPDEIGDTGQITIQAKNDSGAGRNVYLYDVILIPTDEWAGDFTDVANINGSIICKTDNITHFIDIDSVRNPKVLGRSLVRRDDSEESIVANYEFATNGEVILQANADQRLWVLSSHIGSNDEWLSEPWVVWSVQSWKNQRYLTQRGSR